MRYANSTLRHVYSDTQETLKQNIKLENMLVEQREENKKLNSFIDAKIPDLKHYFPLKDSESLMNFLDESNPEQYALRRSEFGNWVSNCCSKKKNLFASAMMKAFFDPSFILSHSWPSSR